VGLYQNILSNSSFKGTVQKESMSKD